MTFDLSTLLSSASASASIRERPSLCASPARLATTLLLILFAAVVPGWAQETTPSPDSTGSAESATSEAANKPQITFETNHGLILVELEPELAPDTVANVLEYARSGFYDGTVFHRVIDGFMIQGGGFDENLHKKPTRPPVKNEGGNGLRNERGTIAMARTRDPHSATAQFYINTVDNPSLDAANNAGGFGYAVFGKVIEGMDVVDAIAKVPTGNRPNGMRNVPLENVVIVKATVSQE